MCLPCALSYSRITRISQLKGWDRVGYDCSLEIRQTTGELLKPIREAALKASMEPMEDLQDQLCVNLSVEQLYATLELNGIDLKSAGLSTNTVDMAVMVADGMTNGLCADCPGTPTCVCDLITPHYPTGI